MSTDDELFTPTEVLGGFSAKRARLLLFQIENRTASLMLQSRRAVARYLTEETAEQQDLAFFEALAEGREQPVRPTMRDLERYAPHWQSLVPPNPTLQATLAHLLGQKYRFRQRDIPHVREALGLDCEGVQQAFLRQYHQYLETIYTSKADPFEQVRWLCWLLEASAEQREGLISSIISSCEYLSSGFHAIYSKTHKECNSIAFLRRKKFLL
jgi:hypothetical protein